MRRHKTKYNNRKRYHSSRKRRTYQKKNKAKSRLIVSLILGFVVMVLLFLWVHLSGGISFIAGVITFVFILFFTEPKVILRQKERAIRRKELIREKERARNLGQGLEEGRIDAREDFKHSFRSKKKPRTPWG